MLDYTKILNYWNALSSEDREKFVIFTSVLCKYYDGDFNWTNRDIPLTMVEMNKIENELPEEISKFIKNIDEQNNIAEEKTYWETSINHEVNKIVTNIFGNFNGTNINIVKREMILNEIENRCHTVFSSNDGGEIKNCSLTTKYDDTCQILTIYIEKKTSNFNLTYICGYEFLFNDLTLNANRFMSKWI